MKLEGVTAAYMDRGITMMKSFACEHASQRVCDEADVDQGGCCNACWARRWAEEMEKRLKKQEVSQ